ncbi:hypothetical protein BCR33DRAFT_711383 [Rhizoclosmatium globosum]|uniref:Uncharacterized protein n=1 Tax=Rhizoclosmatium globosum TaxID=329046 RepID=A0A1Y2D125_9FUNG|nr:hypothetical protein BCR33DRAFT_711383 [Rhizoclosmatium globosum]|eukprot:ORY52978.1 hypothetical protein BCR33DRAFT_711383 [Rhizoclosmatium globosum]
MTSCEKSVITPLRPATSRKHSISGLNSVPPTEPPHHHRLIFAYKYNLLDFHDPSVAFILWDLTFFVAFGGMALSGVVNRLPQLLTSFADYFIVRCFVEMAWSARILLVECPLDNVLGCLTAGATLVMDPILTYLIVQGLSLEMDRVAVECPV